MRSMLIRLTAMLVAFWLEGYLGEIGLVDYPTLLGILAVTFVLGVGPMRLLRLVAGVAMMIGALWS
jgi:hypothetical protein